VVQWVSSFVIGVYVGILADPWFRAWITRNEWARQARDLEEPDRPRPISASGRGWLANQAAAPPSDAELPDERT
jgi:hypothetical protein